MSIAAKLCVQQADAAKITGQKHCPEFQITEVKLAFLEGQIPQSLALLILVQPTYSGSMYNLIKYFLNI